MGVDETQQWCDSCQQWVLARRGSPNHILHLLLTLLTAGLWIIVWVLMVVIRDPYHCPYCGDLTFKEQPPQEAWGEESE